MLTTRRCGRPTASGQPCKAIVRYSPPLERYAPACRSHLSDVERKAIDDDPLWQPEGQIRWFLEHQPAEAELVTASTIGKELALSANVVTDHLKRLEAEGLARRLADGRRTLWAGPALERRLADDARRSAQDERERAQEVARRNEVMQRVMTELRELFAGRAIGASGLLSRFPTMGAESAAESLVIDVDDPDDAEWLLRRLRVPAPDENRPSEREWLAHADTLEAALQPLWEAGWSAAEDDAYFTDYDERTGPLLFTDVHRTGMAVGVEFEAGSGRLHLQPSNDTDTWPPAYSMLDEELIVDLGDDPRRRAADAFGSAGLLDPTHVAVPSRGPVSLSELQLKTFDQWVFEPAAKERGRSLADLMSEVLAYEPVRLYLRDVVSVAGQDVLPDVVPSAAALGIATWCWRNGTAVEDWRVDADVLVVRVNMAVTEVARDHVDRLEGVDWSGLRARLTDGSMRLPDRRRIADLFGSGWPEVRRTVAARLDEWQHIDEALLGPDATLRLLTVGGSTASTRHWWGHGRWKAVCEAIVADAMTAGVRLPPPYDDRGVDSLLADLELRPQQLPDDVLEWFIDMPGARRAGLRNHPATQPIVRLVEPVEGVA